MKIVNFLKKLLKKEHITIKENTNEIVTPGKEIKVDVIYTGNYDDVAEIINNKLNYDPNVYFDNKILYHPYKFDEYTYNDANLCIICDYNEEKTMSLASSLYDKKIFTIIITDNKDYTNLCDSFFDREGRKDYIIVRELITSFMTPPLICMDFMDFSAMMTKAGRLKMYTYDHYDDNMFGNISNRNPDTCFLVISVNHNITMEEINSFILLINDSFPKGTNILSEVILIEKSNIADATLFITA